MGAHSTQRPRSLFQQTSSHTHWPQRLHWMNSGRISATASLQRRVVGRALDQVGQLVGAVGGVAQEAAQHAAGAAEQPGGHAGLAGLPGGHVAVAAALAVELELVAALGGQVVVVVGELDRCHVYPPRERAVRAVHVTRNLAGDGERSQGAEAAARGRAETGLSRMAPVALGTIESRVSAHLVALDGASSDAPTAGSGDCSGRSARMTKAAGDDRSGSPPAPTGARCSWTCRTAGSSA